MTNRIPWGPDSPGYPNCPVPAGHDATVWFRCEVNARDTEPEEWSWKHTGEAGDIIAYCDHDAQDEARELLADIREDLQACVGLSRADPYILAELRSICERAGYGNVMASASALWRDKLGEQAGGEFVAGPCRSTVQRAISRINAYLERKQEEPKA